MAATLLFVMGLVSLLATSTVLLRVRAIAGLLAPYFMLAWLQGEMALIHMIWQGLAAVVLIAFGALDASRGQWGLALLLLSFIGLGYSLLLSLRAGPLFSAALHKALGQDFRQSIPAERRALLRDTIHWREWMRPFSMRRDGVERISDIAYGEAGERNHLDIYKPSKTAEKAPVLLQVHGGGWTIGKKTEQALPLMNHLAQRGWVCVAINYRLSPQHAFPAHIQDTKLAIAWIRDNIAQYGGDPDFIAITGGSAGGHLSSLAALTPNRADYQPGFENADTTVQAAVPFYGVYDWSDEAGSGGAAHMRDFLADKVMQVSPDDNPQLWDNGRSLANINAAAPPMFIVHGSHDSLVWVEDARHFAAALQQVSTSPVAYAELPGAQHAFEIFHSIRSDYAVNAVTDFLEWSYADWCSR